MLCTSGVTDDVTFANNAIMATKRQREKTQGDSDLISFHIYASWFSPPSCR